MKPKKSMLERLKAYHKKCGGYAAVVILSEMMWRKAYASMRTMHTYRLKSARGDYRIVKVTTNLWELKRRYTTIGRLTANPLRVYAALYLINRNGGANI